MLPYSQSKRYLISKIENKIYLQKVKNETLTETNEKYIDEPELITETFKDKDAYTDHQINLIILTTRDKGRLLAIDLNLYNI